jgi:hypothetical protein
MGYPQSFDSDEELDELRFTFCLKRAPTENYSVNTVRFSLAF